MSDDGEGPTETAVFDSAHGAPKVVGGVDAWLVVIQRPETSSFLLIFHTSLFAVISAQGGPRARQKLSTLCLRSAPS